MLNAKDKILSGLARPEVRAKLASKSAKNWADAEYRSKVILSLSNNSNISKHSKELWADEEYKQKTISAHINASDKMSNASKEKWKDSNYRAKVVSSIVASCSSDASKALKSERSKKLWNNSDYAAKTINAMHRYDVKEKNAIARSKQRNRTSSIQQMLYSFLDDLGIEYYKEGEQTRIGYYVFDCIVPHNNKKLLIECQGDYWHSLPEAEKNDRSKFTYISRYFPEHEIMYVWEHEFYCKDRVLDRLKLKLGLEIEVEKFAFNDLVIQEASILEIKEFLDLYHYLGNGRGGKAYGAYLSNKLIACIVFSPPLRQNTASQFDLADAKVRELSRLCIHPSYHKKNFASWLISKIIKLINSQVIIAYADTTIGHSGTIYKASNFKLHHIVPADYWYVDPQGYVMHKRTLYGKAIKMKMTESEFAESKGYTKKFGGQKFCFVYYKY